MPDGVYFSGILAKGATSGVLTDNSDGHYEVRVSADGQVSVWREDWEGNPVSTPSGSLTVYPQFDVLGRISRTRDLQGRAWSAIAGATGATHTESEAYQGVSFPTAAFGAATPTTSEFSAFDATGAINTWSVYANLPGIG